MTNQQTYMIHQSKLFAAVGLFVASVCVSSAQPYYTVGNYNSWNNPSATAMTDDGPVGINGIEKFEYQVTGQTPNSFPGGGGGNNGFKVTDGTWANAWPGNNLQLQYDGSGSATIYFYPGTITPADGWSPPQNRVGHSDTGEAWEVTGDFSNPQWGSDPLAQMTQDASAPGVYTNIYVVATPGSYNFKVRTPGTWNGAAIGNDFGADSGNCVFTTTTPNQAVLFKIDLINGRWQAGGPPAYCNVQFSVDMTFVVANNPGFDPTSVTVNGDALPNGWGGTPCTNNPTAVNPNIYTSSNQLILVGSSAQFQFRCLVDGLTQYDAKDGVGGRNRTLTVPNLASTNLPVVYWNDASPDDYLTADTLVTFNLNMANAVQYPSGPAFDPNPGSDKVYINGDFLGWVSFNPISLASYQLATNSSSGGIYQYSQVFPSGHTRLVTYKYAINGADNEAAVYQNHFRYIRSSGGADYSMPVDIFGYQYVEPKTGGLSIGKLSAGKVPLSWFGYPGYTLNLQSSSDLASWTDVAGTSTITSTNMPITGSQQFFRVIQTAP